ncbi:MAG: DUF559 domain-containing protein, partial [Thioploca sp.]|nr:DUF559 domain-containing protein [Thioploca sp.]
SHFTESGMEYDAKRTTFLNEVGIQVLRFTNNEVLENLENVLEIIRKNVTTYPVHANRLP